MRMLLMATLFAGPLVGQSGPTAADSVRATVARLFEGMRLHDSSMVRSAFAPGARMLAVPRAGDSLSDDSVDGFVAAAGKSGEPWDEQVFAPEIRIDGDLATYFAFYRFSVGAAFLHCGVDAIWLIRTTEGWKIASLIDTRRRSDCDPPSP